MKHYVYKTSSSSGKFYIGRHSTNDTSKPYFGSGKWVKSIKDKTTLTVEILEYASSFEDLKILEEKYINKYINDPNNMNFNNRAVGFPTGEMNWACTESAKEHKKILRQGKTYEELFDAEIAAAARKKIKDKATGRKRNSSWNSGLTKDTNSSLKKMSESKKGNAPWNKGIHTGISSFLGKSHSEDSKNQMSKTQKQIRLTNRRICEHCGKDLDNANYSRHHGPKCRKKL